MGKSQSASEFAHRNASDYQVVWWFDAQDASLIPGQIRQLLGELGEADAQRDDSSTLRALEPALERATSWLLVFDNVENPKSLSSWLPTLPGAAGQRRHVVATTRRKGFDPFGPVRELPPLDVGAATQFLRHRIPEQDSGPALELLAVSMQGLPLALEQACAYLKATGMGVNEYVVLFHTRTAEMLSKGEVLDHASLIATLWDLSLETLTPAALEFVETCAYLSSSAIPLSLFARHPDYLVDVLASVASDPVALSDVIGEVVDYSLARHFDSTIIFHGLTQAAVRARIPRDPMGYDLRLPNVLELLRASAPPLIIGGPDERSAVRSLEPLLPHVLFATGLYTLEEAKDEYTVKTCCDLISESANYFQLAGNYTVAAMLYDASRGLYASVASNSVRRRARALVDSAESRKRLGHPEVALPLAAAAVKLMIDEYGENDIDVAKDLGALARIQHDLGLLDEALDTGNRALAIALKTDGPERSVVATRLNDTALVHLQKGDAAHARDLLEEAYDIVRAGDNNRAIGEILNNLGAAYEANGEVANAIEYDERSLGLLASEMGRLHPHLRNPISRLVALYEKFGMAVFADHLRRWDAEISAPGI